MPIAWSYNGEKGRGVGAESARRGYRAASVEVGSCPDQFPTLACASILDTPSLSTLGLQEKYLASSDQSVEQETMQL